MAVIGNDNYRPGLNPPRAMRGGTGWLSSNIAQLMVFLNGLILTIVAFATLSIFIEEIVNEGFEGTTQDVESHISQNYTNAEEALSAMAYVMQTTPSQDIGEYISKTDRYLKYFGAVYIVERSNSEWRLDQVFKKDEFLGDAPKRDVDNTIISSLEELQEGDSFLKGVSFDEQLYEAYEGVLSGYFGVRAPFKSVSGKENYVLAIGAYDGLVSLDWIAKKDVVQTVSVVSEATQDSLYFYRKIEDGPVNISGNYQAPKSIDILLSGYPLTVQVGMRVGAREAFLRKIPYLMLLFGITLTLIGTLYVRNNQKQSVKLSEMNKELAHKNYELSQQMSERERLNKVIQKSARDNKAIVDSVSDIIFELSVDETIVFLNEAWKKVTGFDLEQSVGRNLFDLLYYQDQDEQKDNFSQLVKGQKKPYRVYTRLRTSDGTFRAVELTMSMIRQDENKDLRIVGTITDVEERRRAERALSEAEKKYRAIVENAASGIYQVTPEGQYLSANPSLAKILGYDRPEDLLRGVVNVTEEVYVDPVQRERFLKDITTSKSPKTIELEIKKNGGDVSWVQENIRPVYDDEDNLIFFEGSMEDINQRKNAEIALMDAKVESDLSNRSKSEFLANMSHELSTPLNSIIGFSEIIKTQAFGEILEKKYVEYADSIFGSGNQLLKVINEILDVSRIDAGDRTLNEGHINVSELVSSALVLLSDKIETSDMQVHNRVIDPSLGLVGEAQSVKQILINLLSNAVKFSDGGGVITLDSEVDARGRLRLSVTDTGIGLSEDEIEKALSPFGQIDTDLNRDKSGTGLGLTLVKSLMRLHGGELDIVSQKGVGTTATLIFPEQRVATRKARGNEASASEETSIKEDS